LLIADPCHFSYYAGNFLTQGAPMPASARHILVETEARCLQLMAEIQFGYHLIEVTNRW
jgi:hypothetical protein